MPYSSATVRFCSLFDAQAHPQRTNNYIKDKSSIFQQKQHKTHHPSVLSQINYTVNMRKITFLPQFRIRKHYIAAFILDGYEYLAFICYINTQMHLGIPALIQRSEEKSSHTKYVPI